VPSNEFVVVASNSRRYAVQKIGNHTLDLRDFQKNIFDDFPGWTGGRQIFTHDLNNYDDSREWISILADQSRKLVL